MFEILIIFGAILFVLCIVFAGIAGLVFVVLMALGTPKEKKAEGPPVVVPYPTMLDDLAQYKRLSLEMFAYSNRYDVVHHQEIVFHGNGHHFMRTTSDRFGKIRYVEWQRSFGATLQCTLCRYDDGAQTPTESAMIEVATSRVEWGVHYENITDIYQNGSKISFWDEHGGYHQARVPKKPVETDV